MALHHEANFVRVSLRVVYMSGAGQRQGRSTLHLEQ